MERLIIYAFLLMALAMLLSYQYVKQKKLLHELILVAFWGGVITLITSYAGFMSGLFYSCLLLGLGYLISKPKIKKLHFWKGPGIGIKRTAANKNNHWYLVPLSIPEHLLILIWLVFIFRQFMYEPFVVPSGSMLPTIKHWDIVLVDKNYYGFKNPVNNQIFIKNHQIERGDIITFTYENGGINYVKRVIGLPGDKISYYNRELKINQQKIENIKLTPYGFTEQGHVLSTIKYEENLFDKKINVLYDRKIPSFVPEEIENFKDREYCNFQFNGFDCLIPANKYFVFGDNRDYSKDSRYLGFVEKEKIQGKLKMILFNLSDNDRKWIRF